MIRPMTRALAPALLLTTALAHAQNMRATIEADGPVGMTQREGVLTIRNGSTSLVKLRKCTFPEAATLAMPSDAVMLSMTGWQEPSRVWRLSTEPRRARTFAVLWSASARRAVLVGFTTFDRATTSVEAVVSGDGTVRVSAWTDFEGLPLAAGASIDCEKLAVVEGDNPDAMLDTWTTVVQAYYKPAI